MPGPTEIDDLLGATGEAVRLLLGSLPDIAMVVDRDGRILYANTDSPERPVTGSNLFEHDLGEDAHARMRRALGEVFEDGRSVAYEVDSRAVADGGPASYLSRWSPIERDGVVVAGLIIASDITHRRRLEREIEVMSQVGTWEWDTQTNEVTWSDQLYDIFGLDRDGFTPTYEAFLDRLHPDDRDFVHMVVQQAYASGEPFSVDERVVRPDGQVRVLVSNGRIERDAHGRRRMIGVCLDVTERKRAERELEQVSRRQEVILSSAAEGILGIDRDGTVTFANPAARELLGWSDREVCGRNVHDLLHSRRSGEPSHGPDACPVLLSLRGGVVQHMQDDVFWRSDGESFPVHYTSSPILERGTLTGAVLTFNDVTERKRFETQLQYLADHDPITGLYNRRRFEQELAGHLAYHQRYETGGAVLAIDLDNFKDVNDTLGHKAGDEVIGRVARNIRSRLRDTDTLARLGGDEFAVLLPEAGIEQAQAVARVILEAVRRDPIVVGSEKLRVSASVGITCFGNRSAVTGEELLVEADLAMYEAKGAGRDRAALYTPLAVRQAQIESRLKWVERIHAALESDLFELHAQPVVAVETGQPVQHELLLRLQGADGELVLPGAFLPSAERFGLIAQIDRWVLRHTARLLAETPPEVRLQVNISGATLLDATLPDAIGSELSEAGVDPSRLIVEVTESAAIANLEETGALAQALSDLGCKFALDDFGTGFGSFYYLKYLPFDYLKIDGDFIGSLPASRTDQLVVRALADIARGLGKQAIAESVGDEDTLALLREFGVDLAQGYHVGRPAPSRQLVRA